MLPKKTIVLFYTHHIFTSLSQQQQFTFAQNDPHPKQLCQDALAPNGLY